MISLVALVTALCGSSDASWFAGGQIVHDHVWYYPTLVAGARRGRWDLWGGVSGNAYAYEIPASNRYAEDAGTFGWWRTSLWTGANWSSRDSGVSQIAGAECRWLGVQPDGIILPLNSAQFDPLWGIRWSGDGLRCDMSIGLSLEWSSDDYFEWRIELEPVFRVGIAKVW